MFQAAHAITCARQLRCQAMFRLSYFGTHADCVCVEEEKTCSIATSLSGTWYGQMGASNRCDGGFACVAQVHLRRTCQASLFIVCLFIVCAGGLKAADLIEFLGRHAAAGPSKGKASDGSGDADADEAAGGNGSEKAVPQVHSI